MNETTQAVGRSIQRFDARNKLTGETLFCADTPKDAHLFLKALRSRHHHARILAIDTAKALNIDGVKDIFTARDIPGNNLMGILNKDQPLLADDKVRSKADPVALVAADSEGAALKALDAIEVTYEELPAVFTPDAALEEGAPLIHDKGNLLCNRKVKKNDVDAAFARWHPL